MSTYRISMLAQADLDQIWRHIASDNRSAATGVLQRFHDAFLLLATQSGMGEACDDLLPGLRRFTVGQYVVYFRQLQGRLEIARVVHGARNSPRPFA